MANRYWVGGSDTWDTTAGSKWASSSGGGGGASAPTLSDNVFFDANSGNCVVSISSVASPYCYNINTTGFVGTITSTGGKIIVCTGDTHVFYPNTTFHSTIQMTPAPSSSVTIQTNGMAFQGSIYFVTSTPTKTFTFLDDLSVYDYIGIYGGKVDFNDKNVSCNAIYISDTYSYTKSLYLGSGTIDVLNWLGIATFSPSLFTLYPETSTISIKNTGIFYGNGLTYNKVKVGYSSASIRNSNTISELQLEATSSNNYVYFEAGTTQTISSMTTNISSSRLFYLRSTSTGSTYTLSKSSGGVELDRVSILDCTATGGATWVANNAIDAGRNSGWLFNIDVSFTPTSSLSITSSMQPIEIIYLLLKQQLVGYYKFDNNVVNELDI